ncbi:MAG: ABC transporter permease, partial [Acidimicrobiia bacterium]|nr:ABC transporter permease [Acidimicrobiia bacterium]
MSRTLVGTGRLMRFILRRDRFLLPGWVLWLSIVPMAAASGFKALYPTDVALATAARDLDTNPAFRAMFGPVYGANLGSLIAWRSSIILVIIAILSALTVIRHTRVEEETGRRELVGSTVIGRHAPLAAALAVVALAGVAAGLLIALG